MMTLTVYREKKKDAITFTLLQPDRKYTEGR